jgi:hypothetical protein
LARTSSTMSFAILADAEPWRSMPAGRAGILGILILCSSAASDKGRRVGDRLRLAASGRMSPT